MTEPDIPRGCAPVRPARGGLVHAVVGGSEKTACGRRPRGWVVVHAELTCPRCVALVVASVRSA